jgi:signal transduction histidine kinase
MTPITFEDDPDQAGTKFLLCYHGCMKERSIEPGLLQVFRIFILIRLLVIFISLRLQTLVQAQRGHLYLGFLLLETTILLIYLIWPWLQKSLGKIYLPLALIYATAIPIFEQSVNILLRQGGIIPGDTAASGVWGLVILLLVPLILLSWQYSFTTVTIYITGTAVFEWILTIPIGLRLGLDNSGTIGTVLVRSIIFLLIGSIITRLMRDQRQQRQALASANAKLGQHAATIEQLATSRERNRLARELHDTLAHTLSGLAVQLEAMDAVWEVDPQSLRPMLARALQTTRDGLGEARGAIQALRATPLADLGLCMALQQMAEAAAQRANLSLQLDLPDMVDNIPLDVEQGIYRIAEQAIANVVQHAGASQLNLELKSENGRSSLTVTDDGRGFNTGDIEKEGHFGLHGMRERTEIIGAKLEILSEVGDGTTIRLEWEDMGDTSSDM